MTSHPLSLKSGCLLIDTKVIGPKGERFAKMILDTGATYTMVDPEILIDAGYDLSCLTTNPITTASGIEYCPFLKIKAISSLGYTMRNIRVCTHSLPTNLPINGLLGLNFLSHFNLHLRFLDKILEITQ